MAVSKAVMMTRARAAGGLHEGQRRLCPAIRYAHGVLWQLVLSLDELGRGQPMMKIVGVGAGPVALRVAELSPTSWCAACCERPAWGRLRPCRVPIASNPS